MILMSNENKTANMISQRDKSLALCGVLFICLLGLLVITPQKIAYAQCSECSCVEDYHGDPNPFAPGTLRRYIYDQHQITQLVFGTAQPIPNTPWTCAGAGIVGTGRLGQHQQFLLEELFLGCSGAGGILPALMMMTEQFVSIMMEQVFIIGTFFDAQNQLETQLLFQDLMAQAHKDYHPSTGMCVIGTNMRSMGAASFNADLSGYILSQHAMKRQLGSTNTNAGEGQKEDRDGRLEQVETRFCDRHDNNRTTSISTGLGMICEGAAFAPTEFANSDIDYSRTVDIPSTLEMDFADGDMTDDRDENDVMALASNLFSHDVFERPKSHMIGMEENEELYLDTRAVIAKRSVAQNSFNNIVAMKAQGSPTNSTNTAQYMLVMLQELGIPDDEIPMYLGDLDDPARVRPSYMSQLEILGKLIYQNPSFYVDLYDKPVNVTRKKTAMRAINSIIQREIYDSQLRSEAIMSLILEHSIIDAQKGVQNKINGLRD